MKDIIFLTKNHVPYKKYMPINELKKKFNSSKKLKT